MRNLVFHFHRHLCESLVEAVWQEDWVVAETFFAVLFFGDDAFHFTFEEMLFAVEVKSDDSSEACLAIFDAFKRF